ncbi:MAG: DUF3127 domain-containing protein [Clostridium sp.]|nr:DUF3127 domain-containing protein [Clostridium sp.]
MAYKITGTIKQLTPTQTLMSKSGKNYDKRDLVIAVRMFDQYTGQPKDDSENTPKFTFIGEKCKDLDAWKVGDVVTISFDVSGRSYTKDGRTEYMTDVKPFHVDRAKALENPTPAPQPAPAVDYDIAPAPTTIPENDDLPF